MSPLNQEQISALIQFIEQAEDPGVITNVIVAAVLNWLYDKANDLSNKTDKDLITGALAYSQAPQIVLKSMGETLDGKHLSVAPIGIIYNETTKHIQKRTSINGETKTDDLGAPVGSLIYCNANTNKLYRWTGSAWSQVGENSGSDAQTQGYINLIQEKLDALIDALANYAFINGKDASMKVGALEWDGATPEPTPVEEPVLTSPTNNGSVNIGSHSGSGVSKVVVIKGAYLTKPLTIAVNGQGFSVSSQSVTAAAANSGTSVTVTYSGISASAMGTLTISSDELDTITISLRASYSEVVVPELTQPAAGASVDVGTVSASGTSVTKRVTIQGSNLTQPLTIGVSGTGFTVSPSTVSAADANQGTTVTVTYTNSSTVQTMLTATGQLTISSSEVNRTVGLTARKEAESVTPTNEYYDNGHLVLHLDGLNQGNTNNAWTDTKGGKVFSYQNNPEKMSNGVKFSNYGDCAICPDALAQAYDGGTIEVCFTPLEGFIDTTTAAVVDNLKRMYHMRLFFMTEKDSNICAMINTNSQGMYINSFASRAQSTAPPSKRNFTVPTIASTISQCATHGIVNGVYDESTLVNAKIGRATTGSGMSIGGMVSNWYTTGDQGNEENSRVYVAMAIIHEIRVYDTLLTEEQMKQNQRVDNERYNLGLTIND